MWAVSFFSFSLCNNIPYRSSFSLFIIFFLSIILFLFCYCS
ncbi:Uncharacterised protein [Klebsiella pneumoniae]|nr:Uncharacterised protein [Klebsiella pneumoniae]